MNLEQRAGAALRAFLEGAGGTAERWRAWSAIKDALGSDYSAALAQNAAATIGVELRLATEQEQQCGLVGKVVSLPHAAIAGVPGNQAPPAAPALDEPASIAASTAASGHMRPAHTDRQLRARHAAIMDSKHSRGREAFALWCVLYSAMSTDAVIDALRASAGGTEGTTVAGPNPGEIYRRMRAAAEETGANGDGGAAQRETPAAVYQRMAAQSRRDD